MDEDAPITYLPMVGKPMPAVREALNWLAGALEDTSFPWDDDHRLARDACKRAAEELEAADGVQPSANAAEVIDGMTRLIDQWHNGVKVPDLWMAAAAGALSAARALLADAVDSPDGAQR